MKEITDTKHSSKVKGDHIYQQCLYTNLLKEVQGILPEKFYILLKDKSNNAIKIKKFMTHFYFIKIHMKNFYQMEFQKLNLKKCSYCNFCDWSNHCNKEWKDKRHPLIKF